MHRTSRSRDAFTLIELLVVIAILAILFIVVLLVLNPAQLLKQARDSNRIQDLATIKSAIGYYLEDQSLPSIGTAGTCYLDANLVITGASSVLATTTCPWFFTASTTNATNTSRSISGGWIPVNLSLVSVGSPIGQWPVDPLNTMGAAGPTTPSSSNWFYSYAATSTNYGFKVAAMMESTKYSNGGPSDVESTDGGDSTNTYEQGTNLAL